MKPETIDILNSINSSYYLFIHYNNKNLEKHSREDDKPAETNG